MGSRFRWALFPAVTALAVLGTLFVWGAIQFGSLGAARAFFGGQVLFVEPAVRSLGTVKANESVATSFRIQNLTARPVTIAGSRSSCDCFSATKMPVRIEPHESVDLDFQVHPGTVAVINGFRQQVELFLDVSSEPVVLTVEAVVE